MNTFSSPETLIISLCEESNLSRGLDSPDLEDDWRVFVVGVVEHSIEFLHESQVQRLIFGYLESEIFILISLSLQRHKRISMIQFGNADRVIDECLQKLAFR